MQPRLAARRFRRCPCSRRASLISRTSPGQISSFVSRPTRPGGLRSGDPADRVGVIAARGNGTVAGHDEEVRPASTPVALSQRGHGLGLQRGLSGPRLAAVTDTAPAVQLPDGRLGGHDLLLLISVFTGTERGGAALRRPLPVPPAVRRRRTRGAWPARRGWPQHCAGSTRRGTRPPPTVTCPRRGAV